MKKLKKSLAVLLSIVICLSFSSMLVFANTSNMVSENVNLLQEGRFNCPQQTAVMGYAYKQEKALGTTTGLSITNVNDFIYSQLLEMKSEILIFPYGVKVGDIGAIYQDLVNSHPDLFFVSGAVSYNYVVTDKENVNNNTVYKLVPEYNMAADEVEAAQAVVSAGTERALAIVDDSMTDEEKALVIHDYICDNAVYADVDENSHSLYGFFKDGKIVCAGYALTYSYFMNMLGINCKYIASEGMLHAWNAVQIGGNWYHTDVTWDDLSYSSNPIIGAMLHRCFLKSTSAISSEIGSYHYDFDSYMTAYSITANDTSYDDYFWNGINSKIYCINNAYYYPNYDFSKRTFKIVKRQNNTVTPLSNTEFPMIYVTLSSTSNDGTTDHTFSFNESLSRLSFLDNKFYFTSAKNIYSMNLKGKSYLITSNSTSNYVGINNSGNNIRYQLYTDFSTSVLDKKEYFKTYITTPSKDKYNNYPDVNDDSYVNVKDYRLIAE